MSMVSSFILAVFALLLGGIVSPSVEKMVHLHRAWLVLGDVHVAAGA